MTSTTQTSQLVREWRSGDSDAMEALSARIQTTMRRIAGRLLAGERRNHTIQPTALVNEAYLRLLGSESLALVDRSHLVALMARIMRRVLVDYERERKAAKRGAGASCITLIEALDGGSPNQEVELLDLEAALTRLATIEPRLAQVAVLRFLAGLTVEETAIALDISKATVKRDWSVARTWLARELDRS